MDERDENPGVALNRLRWSRTTAEQRSAVARELNRIRWAKRRKAKKGKKAKGEATS